VFYYNGVRVFMSKRLYDLIYDHETCYDGNVMPKKSMRNQTFMKSRLYFSRVKLGQKRDYTILLPND